MAAGCRGALAGAAVVAARGAWALALSLLLSLTCFFFSFKIGILHVEPAIEDSED